MSDPNWLYSALAQSAAAIVGIFGAFVTSKVIWMAGERSRIERRNNELKLEIQEQSYSGLIDEKWDTLQGRKEELRRELDEIILPKHFTGLILALIYFTGVGVVLPLYLLPITPEQHLFWKPIVLFLFITGLIAVFSYILIEIKHITEKPSNI
jgi:hypothetical protein